MLPSKTKRETVTFIELLCPGDTGARRGSLMPNHSSPDRSQLGVYLTGFPVRSISKEDPDDCKHLASVS